LATQKRPNHGNKSEAKEKGKECKRGKSKDYGKSWFVQTKNQERKNSDADAFTAQHGAKPHGQRLQHTPMLDMVLGNLV
jgi:hypothetical protein